MRFHYLLVVLVWVPFLSIFGFAATGDSSAPHIAFHLFALALLVPAVRVAWRLRASAPTRTQHLVAWVISVTLPLAVLGHALELLTALVRLAQDGWTNRDTSDVFEQGPHAWVASLTIPSMMLSMVFGVVLLVVAAVQSRRQLEQVG
jgi:hypothetical protein